MKLKVLAVTLLTCTFCVSAMAENTQQGREMFAIQFGSTGPTIGASMIPPQGDGWTLTRPRSGGIDVSKPGASKDENSQIELYTITMTYPFEPGPAYLAKLEADMRASYARRGLLKVTSLELADAPAQGQCLRGHLLLERAAPNGGEQTWHSERYFMSCQFTRLPEWGAEVAYTQRYHGQHNDPEFAAKAKTLLDSVQLVDH